MKVGIASPDRTTSETLRRMIASAPQHELIWVVPTADDAERQCAGHRPDVLLLDLALPGAEVLDATRRIMAATPCGIIVVTTSVERHSALVFAAMGAGALDVVVIPPAQARRGRRLTAPVLQKIRMTGLVSATPPSTELPTSRRPLPALIAIVASAGGPPAIAAVLGGLEADIHAAILVVQHVDARFSESMARWFGSQTPLQVRLARQHDSIEAGVVYMAAGDHHMVVNTEGILEYTATPARSAYRPSADVLLQSIARNWRGKAIGIVLSGMGSDGAVGLRALREAGARTIAQDESTSAVYGMPRAAAAIDAATDILPLQDIAQFIRTLLQPDVDRRWTHISARR